MSNIQGEILKLQLEGVKLTPEDSTGDNIEWAVGQDCYRVQIRTNSKLETCIFLVADSNNRVVETLLMDLFIDESNQSFYIADSQVAKLLKSGTKLYIGAVYGVKDTNTSEIRTFKTEPLKVQLNSTIDSHLDIADIAPNYTILQQIINKFESGKAIEALNCTKITNNNLLDDGMYLEIKYVGVKEPELIGPISPTLEGLGVLEKRENTNTGGGGKLGNNATLDGSKSGFAGGYSSKANAGAAVGEEAVSENGFAAGKNAKANSKDGIAIGKDSSIENNNGTGIIAIGTGATAKNNDRNTIIIGQSAKADNSYSSVIIGGTTLASTPGEEYSEDPNGSDLPKISNRTRATESNQAVIIGHKASAEKTNNSVVIGALATSRGEDKQKATYNVSIGYNTITRNQSCIGIGVNAKAGTDDKGNIVEGNTLQEQTGSKLQTSAIAIGRGAWARSHSTIALGKHSKAIHYGCISIGHSSVAGNINEQANDKASYEDDAGSKAIAIGWSANATAKNSVQLGSGTNSTSNSLQFMTTTVVKDKAVQFNLSGSGAQGVLPISKGGTNATTAQAARKNLGINYGTHLVKDLSLTKLSSTGIDITIKFPSDMKFTSIPQVIANLGFGDDYYDPKSHHFYIKSITKTGFVLRYNCSDKHEDVKKTFNVNYVAIL